MNTCSYVHTIVCIYDDTLICIVYPGYPGISIYDDTLIYSGSKDPFLSSKNSITIFRFSIDFACNNSIAMVVLIIKGKESNYEKITSFKR